MNTKSYKIIFKHNSPSNEDMKKLNVQLAYPEIKLKIEVFDKNDKLIYSTLYIFDCVYYYKDYKDGHKENGHNFNHDRMKFTYIKWPDDDILDDIKKEIKDNRNKFGEIFKNTLFASNTNELLETLTD